MAAIESCSDPVWDSVEGVEPGACVFGGGKTDSSVQRDFLLADVNADGIVDLVVLYATAKKATKGKVSPGAFVLVAPGTGGGSFGSPTFSYLLSASELGIGTSDLVAQKCGWEMAEMGTAALPGLALVCRDEELGTTVSVSVAEGSVLQPSLSFARASVQHVSGQRLTGAHWSTFLRPMAGMPQPDFFAQYIGPVGFVTFLSHAHGVPSAVNDTTHGLGYTEAERSVAFTGNLSRTCNYTTQALGSDVMGSAVDADGWTVVRAPFNGDGTFGAMQRFTLSTDPFSTQGKGASWMSILADITGDGRTDVLALRLQGGKGGFELYVSAANSDGSGFTLANRTVLSNKVPVPGDSDIITPFSADITGSGRPTFGYRLTHFPTSIDDHFSTNYYLLDSPKPANIDRIEAIDTGLGHPTKFEYALLSDPDKAVYTPAPPNTPHPPEASASFVPAPPSQRWVVHKVIDPLGLVVGGGKEGEEDKEAAKSSSQTPTALTYHYANAWTDIALGQSGFQKINVTKESTGHVTELVYSTDTVHGTAGHLLRTTHFRPSPTDPGQMIRILEKEATLSAVLLRDSPRANASFPLVGRVWLPRKDSEVTRSFDQDTGKDLILEHTKTYTYDDASQAIREEGERFEDITGASMEITKTNELYDVPERLLYGLPARTTERRVSRPAGSAASEEGRRFREAVRHVTGAFVDNVTRSEPGYWVDANGTVIEEDVTERVFDNTTGLPISIMQHAASATNWLRKRILYDSRGLVHAVQTQGAEEDVVREQVFEHDSSGRFLLSSCDGDGTASGVRGERCERKEYNDLGVIVQTTTSTNITYKYVSDLMGRPLGRTNELGLWTSLETAWCVGKEPESVRGVPMVVAPVHCDDPDAVFATIEHPPAGPPIFHWNGAGSQALGTTQTLHPLHSESGGGGDGGDGGDAQYPPSLVQQSQQLRTTTAFDKFSEKRFSTHPYLQPSDSGSGGNTWRLLTRYERDDFGQLVGLSVQEETWSEGTWHRGEEVAKTTISRGHEWVNITTPEKLTTARKLDPLGRTIFTVDPAESGVEILRTQSGKPISVLARGNVTSGFQSYLSMLQVGLDQGGNPRALWSADRGLTLRRYSARGKLLYQRMEDGSEMHIERDELDREVRRDEGDRVCVSKYDTVFHSQLASQRCESTRGGDAVQESWKYNAVGQVVEHTQAVEQGGVEEALESIAEAQRLASEENSNTAFWDPTHNNLRLLQKQAGSGFCHDSTTVWYDYDALGRLWRDRDSKGGCMVHLYSEQNPFLEVGLRRCGESDQDAIWRVSEVDSMLRPTRIDHDNGVTELFTYHRLTGVIANHAAVRWEGVGSEKGVVVLFNESISVDEDARVTSRSDHLHHLHEQFFYDSSSRLTRVENPGVGNDTFEYDWIGNRVEGPGGVKLEYGDSQKIHVATSIGGKDVISDVMGRRRAFDATFFGYDSASRTTAVARGAMLISRTFSGSGQLVAQREYIRVSAQNAQDHNFLHHLDEDHEREQTSCGLPPSEWKEKKGKAVLVPIRTSLSFPNGLTVVTLFRGASNMSETYHYRNLGGRAIEVKHVIDDTDEDNVHSPPPYHDPFSSPLGALSSSSSRTPVWYEGRVLQRVVTRNTTVSPTTLHLLTDQQGSLRLSTNEAGEVESERSYTAFGRTRDAATWQPKPSGPPPGSPAAARDGIVSVQDIWAAQPELAGVGTGSTMGWTIVEAFGAHGISVALGEDLMFMNARVYDVENGMFASPDSFVAGQGETITALNPFAYGRHNPLLGFDPSGCSWFSHAWHSITHAISSVVSGIVHAVEAVVHAVQRVLTSIPLLNTVVSAVLDYILGPYAFIWSFIDGYLTTGSFTGALENSFMSILSFGISKFAPGGAGANSFFDKLASAVNRPGSWASLGVSVAKGAGLAALHHQNPLRGALMGAVSWAGAAVYASAQTSPNIVHVGDLDTAAGTISLGVTLSGIIGRAEEGFVDGVGMALVSGDSLGAALKAGFKGAETMAVDEIGHEFGTVVGAVIKEVPTLRSLGILNSADEKSKYSKATDPKLAKAEPHAGFFEKLHNHGISIQAYIVLDARDVWTKHGYRPNVNVAATATARWSRSILKLPLHVQGRVSAFFSFPPPKSPILPWN